MAKKWKLWTQTQKISEPTRLRLYQSFILPILLYNCGAWALTKAEMDRLHGFHRRQLRKVLGIHYPRRISNDTLYDRCNSEPLGFRVIQDRWTLFGHILRRPSDILANEFMREFFKVKNHSKWRGNHRMTLPVALLKDLEHIEGYQFQLKTQKDLDKLRQLAADRPKWKKMVKAILNKARDDLTHAKATQDSNDSDRH
jgi:hypothetical protein